jgi:hypothetical protein
MISKIAHAKASLGNSRVQGMPEKYYLNKDKIPYFNACRIIIVNQHCCIAITNSIIMNFGTRSTRTSITHLPKIILFKGQNKTLDVKF